MLEDAGRGTEEAWREIVNRYSSLVFAVCHRHGITGADAEDVRGSVWLRLVINLKTIREPEALPGWLQTTTRNECLMLLRHKTRQIPTDSPLLGDPTQPGSDTALIGAEERDAARDAFARLPMRNQELLSMLFADPPRTYQEISSVLGMPVGAIGPTRARVLAKVRRAPAIMAILGADRIDATSRARGLVDNGRRPL
jgi:RNA polymerase sigma factor (sigma-70 family)